MDDEKAIEALGNVISSTVEYFNDGIIIKLALQLYEEDLMIPILPWYIRIIQFVKRYNTYTTLSVLFNNSPALAKEYVLGAVDHLHSYSYDQTEINKLVEIINPYVAEMKSNIDAGKE